MKTLYNPWFVAGCLLWLVCFVLKKLHQPLPYLNGYLTDAFAIPVIANLGLWFQRVFVYKNNSYVLTAGHIVFIVVYVTVVFEVMLPHYSKRYTSDWIDVALYFCGGFFFWLMMNKTADQA